MSELTDKSGKLCPLIAFDQMVGGKYKLRILYELIKGAKRYGVLRSSLVTASLGKPVTPRILSRELKELEKRGLVNRKQYPVVPPRVEYSLTERGQGLIPVIMQIGKWGMAGAHDEPPARAPASGLRPLAGVSSPY